MIIFQSEDTTFQPLSIAASNIESSLSSNDSTRMREICDAVAREFSQLLNVLVKESFPRNKRIFFYIAQLFPLIWIKVEQSSW